ncbi:tRNA 2-thiocytidine biosynthesis TtcA family protein [Pectinatus brassicae]|uniref:tRNA(Ile)-lysidine synthase TilS/MesJ n=1 Tax=Pectinatus brassicae TaxID=862415 RepID=A0A840UWY0_9FIRM|nr:tRNA 2-thiocytidine biosynthesis TtcA family protein [Pectinatus brassicae]MBB5337354.1 tRNA(Ile)-lysidine synthase TilS/MesJ [Pectinatus brassicae]
MNINIPQQYFSKLMRAVVEFNLIENNDHILIGLSGGKDSLFLTYALAILRERLPKKFTLSAVTIDPMFTDNFAADSLTKFCRNLGIEHSVHKVDINGTIKSSSKNPCFTCAYFRRGAINRLAIEKKCNKVAYAHHHDDAVETFFMNLLYSGQIQTFTPSTYLDKSHLTVIRPLIYFREEEMRTAVKYHKMTPLASPCPIDGTTMRQDTKELLASLNKTYPFFYEHLAAAMRENAVGSLWSAAPDRKQMKAIYDKFIHKSSRS